MAQVPPYARITDSTDLDTVSIKRPFSNFDFIEDYFGGLDTLRRLMSQVRRLGGATMVVEKLSESNDIQEEDADIRLIYPDFEGSSVWRLTFFSEEFSGAKALSSVPQETFIGYAIVKENRIRTVAKDFHFRVYESVIRISRYDNRFVRGEKSWKCRSGQRTFEVKGYLYAQQNNITTSCGHVALRTVASCYHKSGDMSYREMNKLLGIDHKEKTATQGLNSAEMRKILQAAGAKCIVADFVNLEDKMASRIPFQRWIYGCIESGYPAIIFFGTNGDPVGYHAIPVFGHTFNQDTWVARADAAYFKIFNTEYIPSESWLSMFLGHDDNWGSNLCIPKFHLQATGTTRNSSQPQAKNKKGSKVENRVAYVICTLPKKIRLDPIKAEVIGGRYLLKLLQECPNMDNLWINRLRRAENQNQIVLRPILIECSEYVSHLQKVRAWNKVPISAQSISEIQGLPLDQKVWMIELSLHELFSGNLRKVGEVLIRSDVKPKNENDLDSFVLARLPQYFALYKGKSVPGQHNSFTFISSGIDSHVELYGCEEATEE